MTAGDSREGLGAVSILLPSNLRRFTGGPIQVQASGRTLRDLLQDLDQRFPGLGPRLCEDDGRLRKHVIAYVNNEDCRFLRNEDTPVVEGDEVSFVAAVAGG